MVELLVNIGQITVALLPLFATILGYDSLKKASEGFAPLSFPLRLMILVACSCGLGAGLGFGIIYLTKKDSYPASVTAYVFSAVSALLLVVIVDALSARSNTLPEVNLFLFVGLALVMSLLTFMFRAGANTVNTAVIEDRATMVAMFAGTAALSGLLVYIWRGLS